MNTDADSIIPVAIGLDDGYACTKIALPDGRLVAVPSRARIGQAGMTWINDTKQRVFEYETDDKIYAVGDVDGASTHFDDYPWSGLNRAIVQHALQEAGLAGRSVHAVSGLPVSSFYLNNGEVRSDVIAKKQETLKIPTRSLSAVNPAAIAFHDVIPEALAAWYDDVIVENADGVSVDADRLSVPVAVVDIGGRTTDYVVVKDQGVVHASSGSLQCGMLTVKRLVSDAIQLRFGLDAIGERLIDQALQRGIVRLQGADHDVTEFVGAAKREVVERIYVETRRQLGLGVELDRVVFVGGGTVALCDEISNWYPHQSVAPHPAFANARGMLKYLRYVCDASDVA